MLGPNRLIRPTHSLQVALLRIGDAICLALTAFAAESLTGAPLHRALTWLVILSAVVGFHLFGELCGIYRNWRGAAIDHEILSGAVAWSLTCVALAGIGFVSGQLASVARLTAISWAVLAPLLLAINRLALRWMLRSLRKHDINTQRYAIVGATELGIQLAQNISGNPALGLRLLGFFDDRPSERTLAIPSDIGNRIGNLDELVQAARTGRVEMIYITFPMRAEERIRGVLNRLADSTASVYIVPDFFVFELLHARWTDIGGLPAVSIFENPFYGVDGISKRIMDLIITSLLLVLCAVPMAAVALLVKLSSPGPVFFRQRRYGLNGQEIRVWKFRTMRVCEDGAQIVQASRNDTRITPIGRILRRTSIDELPQVFNVLAGTMSLVGPRPHASAQNEHYRGMIRGYMLRHKVKPGITGLAQVHGCRGETDTVDKMQQRIHYDHQYIQQWSLWLDLRILLKTIPVVLARTNAY